MQPRPIVGLSSDLKHIAPHDYHCVGDKYVRAIIEAAGAIPILLPALTEGLPAREVLSLVDGLVLTGSYSDLHPKHYAGGEPLPGKPTDPRRDETNLSLIPAAIEAGVPLFGICRGLQEMNVALGGSLHQAVHNQPGFNNHLEDPQTDLDTQYGVSHPVFLTEGGLLARVAGTQQEQVNSLHGQGIDRLASGVTVEATAADGLVESFSITDPEHFVLAVQWHPEWKPLQHPFYAATWAEFGRACQRSAARRSDRRRT